ncbi:FAD-dependent oxidoreductase [Cognatiyoonia sp. IB215182]|uniref:FAD-dependent oxidoreductase n=1 Tax=Cognatiyoonia sp. IB215182 TaxID=3097353 RepID=UPI002A0D86CC|nr:FAD-dependent oxidoreductase [Cognatiyoonia sp. IB215182]MDX8355422.1 FAD-dependent oxidoreductase [Cognatiyoonia sp. IB215182]
MTQSRRRFLLGAAAGAAILSLPSQKAQAVVLGAGPAGAHAALSLARAQPGLSVVLVERDPTRFNPVPDHQARFLRVNTMIAYGTLQEAGVEIVLDEAVGIDWSARGIKLFSGRVLAFDRLYLAPGAEAVPEDIAGLDARARHMWPAAWGSPREAHRLQTQIARLPEDGHVVLRLPKDLSHPAVAHDRAVWLAGNCKRLTVLDGGRHVQLRDAFHALLPTNKIDWYMAGEGGQVLSVNAEAGRIETDAGLLTARVVNFVPQQGAGRIARSAGLVDETGWCPVDARGRSTRRPGVTVLGDGRRDTSRVAQDAIHDACHVEMTAP